MMRAVAEFTNTSLLKLWAISILEFFIYCEASIEYGERLKADMNKTTNTI